MCVLTRSLQTAREADGSAAVTQTGFSLSWIDGGVAPATYVIRDLFIYLICIRVGRIIATLFAL